MLKLTFDSYVLNDDDNDSGHTSNNAYDDDADDYGDVDDDNDDDHIANAAADNDE